MGKRDQIQQEASQKIKAERDLIVKISLRLGKTKIGIEAIEEDESVLVVYPDDTIKKGWDKDLEKFKPLSTDITFTTKNSLKKYRGRHFNFLIIDEPQLCCSAKQLEILKTITYDKRVALTGALNNKTAKLLRDNLGLEVKYEYGLSDAIRDGIVKDYKIFIHLGELDNHVRRVAYKKFKKDVVGTDYEAYKHYTATMDYFRGAENVARENEDFSTVLRCQMGFKKYMGLRTNLIYNSDSLMDMAGRLIHEYKDEKVLIYTLRQNIADMLSDKTYHTGNKDIDALEMFKESEKGHLAVVNCVRAGVTIKNLNRVIFHAYESNTEIFINKLGRSLLYENKDDKAIVHICTLKGTQMETWVNNACKLLEQDKIYYVYKGKVYPKFEWYKMLYPKLELYLYEGSICHYSHDDEIFGSPQYVFLDNPEKCYGLRSDKLIKL